MKLTRKQLRYLIENVIAEATNPTGTDYQSPESKRARDYKRPKSDRSFTKEKAEFEVSDEEFIAQIKKSHDENLGKKAMNMLLKGTNPNQALMHARMIPFKFAQSVGQFLKNNKIKNSNDLVRAGITNLNKDQVEKIDVDNVMVLKKGIGKIHIGIPMVTGHYYRYVISKKGQKPELDAKRSKQYQKSDFGPESLKLNEGESRGSLYRKRYYGRY
jgi:hypothetical protein